MQAQSIDYGKFLIRCGGKICLAELNGTYVKEIEILFESNARRPRGKKFEANSVGDKLAKELGLNFYRKHKYIPGIKEAKLQAEKIRLQAELKLDNDALKIGENHWDTWRLGFNSDEIATAELIRYINKYAKRFPKYKLQTHDQTLLQEEIYDLKDAWLELNISNLTNAVISAKFTNDWIDYDSMYSVRDATGEWQDPDDFQRSETTIFYAYSFNIEGQEYKFHSKEQLVDICPEDLNQHGSTDPLQEYDLCMKASEAILAVRFILGIVSGAKKFNRNFNENTIAKRDIKPAYIPADIQYESVKAPNESKMISVAGLKALGWTDGGIKNFLGEPEQFATNPHYKSAAPMRLYERDRVMQVMDSIIWKWWRREIEMGRRPM